MRDYLQEDCAIDAVSDEVLIRLILKSGVTFTGVLIEVDSIYDGKIVVQDLNGMTGYMNLDEVIAVFYQWDLKQVKKLKKHYAR